MDKLILFLIPMLILQCFLHWCSPDEYTYKLESFKRWNTTRRFLKAEWNGKKSAFKLSFKGLRNDTNTNFTFRYETPNDKSRIRIHLAKPYSNYSLAVNNTSRRLVVKEYTTADSITNGGFIFTQERVSIPFTNESDSFYLAVIQSVERTGEAIKCTNSGLVSLGKKENCGCLIRIT